MSVKKSAKDMNTIRGRFLKFPRNNTGSADDGDEILQEDKEERSQ